MVACHESWHALSFVPSKAFSPSIGTLRPVHDGRATGFKSRSGFRTFVLSESAKNQGANDPNLSEAEKQQAKGLADAWIKVDKVNECKTALQGRSIYLLGLPSAPMKSVGILLQKRFENYRFLDAVEITAGAAKQTADCQDPRPLTAAIGAEAVLDVGEQVMDQLQAMPRSIFACDARMVQRPQNEVRMGQGVIVYMQSAPVPPEGSSWTQEELEAIVAENGAKMESMSDCIVNLPAADSMAPDDLAIKVIEEVRSYCLATKNRASRRGSKGRNPSENRQF
eukprot:CAMPEP_0173074152 /NCGR_PEP_ID=MMETSP1102-20130122/10836_1 /TAXON_ID=49646 /ORGANISM="Geminigera sp., Strain Caron Lab Isolate" /LENGTH=280 /DNA_ID=CAMNT_0013943145 /DNA_START=20 /DNA_END=862 /DNA_ORIENTATION=+